MCCWCILFHNNPMQERSIKSSDFLILPPRESVVLSAVVMSEGAVQHLVDVLKAVSKWSLVLRLVPKFVESKFIEKLVIVFVTKSQNTLPLCALLINTSSKAPYTHTPTHKTTHTHSHTHNNTHTFTQITRTYTHTPTKHPHTRPVNVIPSYN